MKKKLKTINISIGISARGDERIVEMCVTNNKGKGWSIEFSPNRAVLYGSMLMECGLQTLEPYIEAYDVKEPKEPITTFTNEEVRPHDQQS